MLKIAYNVLTSNSKTVNVEEEFSQAGLSRCKIQSIPKDFGLADAYVLATARKLQSKILTGDMHFKNVKEASLI